MTTYQYIYAAQPYATPQGATRHDYNYRAMTPRQMRRFLREQERTARYQDYFLTSYRYSTGRGAFSPCAAPLRPDIDYFGPEPYAMDDMVAYLNSKTKKLVMFPADQYYSYSPYTQQVSFYPRQSVDETQCSYTFAYKYASSKDTTYMQQNIRLELSAPAPLAASMSQSRQIADMEHASADFGMQTELNDSNEVSDDDSDNFSVNYSDHQYEQQLCDFKESIRQSMLLYERISSSKTLQLSTFVLYSKSGTRRSLEEYAEEIHNYISYYMSESQLWTSYHGKWPYNSGADVFKRARQLAYPEKADYKPYPDQTIADYYSLAVDSSMNAGIDALTSYEIEMIYRMRAAYKQPPYNTDK